MDNDLIITKRPSLEISNKKKVFGAKIQSASTQSLYDCFNFKNVSKAPRKKKPSGKHKLLKIQAVNKETSHQSIETINTQDSRKQMVTSPKLHDYLGIKRKSQ